MICSRLTAATRFIPESTRIHALSASEAAFTPYISNVFTGTSKPWKPASISMPTSVLKRTSVETTPPPRRASRLDLRVSSAGRLDLGAETATLDLAAEKARAEVVIMKSILTAEGCPEVTLKQASI